jgi:hypothetical protein
VVSHPAQFPLAPPPLVPSPPASSLPVASPPALFPPLAVSSRPRHSALELVSQLLLASQLLLVPQSVLTFLLLLARQLTLRPRLVRPLVELSRLVPSRLALLEVLRRLVVPDRVVTTTVDMVDVTRF